MLKAVHRWAIVIFPAATPEIHCTTGVDMWLSHINKQHLLACFFPLQNSGCPAALQDSHAGNQTELSPVSALWTVQQPQAARRAGIVFPVASPSISYCNLEAVRETVCICSQIISPGRLESAENPQHFTFKLCIPLFPVLSPWKVWMHDHREHMQTHLLHWCIKWNKKAPCPSFIRTQFFQHLLQGWQAIICTSKLQVRRLYLQFSWVHLYRIAA